MHAAQFHVEEDDEEEEEEDDVEGVGAGVGIAGAATTAAVGSGRGCSQMAQRVLLARLTSVQCVQVHVVEEAATAAAC